MARVLIKADGSPWEFGSLADYGERWWEQQEGFERGMLTENWGKLKVPLCLSFYGLFRHEEVDA